MSYLFEKPSDILPARLAARGEASLADIWNASRDAMIYVDNSLSRGAAIQEAYARRVAAIEQATGQKIENPAEIAVRALPERDELATMQAGESRYDAARRRFADRLQQLESEYPDAAAIIQAGRPIEDDAAELAREAAGRMDEATQSREGIGKWAALLGGGVAGALRDPLQVGLLVLGGGPGAGRTAATRLLSAAGREALISGGGEAALQPAVQAWRREAGLPAGFDEAVRNVAFAGALGGGFGLAGQGAAEGFRAVARNRVVGELAEGLRGRLSETGEAALSGEPARMAQALETIRDELPATVRGAIDEIEAQRAVAPPATILPEIHDQNLNSAMRAAEAGGAPAFTPDPAQAARIAEQLSPDLPAATRTGEQSLTDFLIARGGVSEYRGELAAIGADQVKKRGRGSLVRPDGRALDDARLIAAEAGYFDARFGTPENAMEKSTIADLLDLIDEDMRTGGVTTDITARGQARDASNTRALIERDVETLQRTIGPGLADDDIAAALARSAETGEDILDAWASVMERELPEARPARAAGDVDDASAIPPGWDDADLDTLAARMSDPQSGIDNPAAIKPLIADELATLDAELDEVGDAMAIPFGDETLTAREVKDLIARSRHNLDIVEACRA